MSKKYYDEDGNEVKNVKETKPWYKRWWVWALAIILLFAIFGGGDDEPSEGTTAGSDTEQAAETSESNETAEESEETTSEEQADTSTENESQEEVPREFQNALRSAQNYVDIMPFSEAGLYHQLTAEYGDQYPEEAAQYAIENVEVDYNEEALEAATNYQEIMPMSDEGLYDQLTSEHGDQFTAEQAQYAIDNLE